MILFIFFSWILYQRYCIVHFRYELYLHFKLVFFFHQLAQQHQDWLEDLVIRLLCVFALDRFGDFVSDEVRHHFYVLC